jgi:hypothetical protein
MKFILRSFSNETILVTAVNYLENEVDLIFTGVIPIIKKAWLVFNAQRIDATSFCQSLSNHMHYSLGKRDVFVLRNTIIALMKNQVENSQGLSLAKNAKLVLQIETWQGVETYSITLNLQRMYFGEIECWDAKVAYMGEIVSSLLEKVRRAVHIESPMVKVSRGMFLRKMEQISYFNALMKYSDTLAHPVMKKPNGWWYDPGKGYFSGYFFATDQDMQAMDMYIHFANWEEVE